MPAPLSLVLRPLTVLALILSLGALFPACGGDEGDADALSADTSGADTSGADTTAESADGDTCGTDACVPSQAQISTFEAVPLNETGIWNGSDDSGGFTDGLAHFSNVWNAEYQSWEGFAVSNHTDTTTAGWENQYSAWPGAGHGNSTAYAVAYRGFAAPPTITFPGAPAGVLPEGVWVANTTYAALSMRDGDAYAKKFGGEGGDEPDWLLLTITGHDAGGADVGRVDVYLADFRADDPAEDGILAGWSYVDLRALGPVASLTLDWSSTDMGDFGMNTPAYVALDDLVAAPAE